MSALLVIVGASAVFAAAVALYLWRGRASSRRFADWADRNGWTVETDRGRVTPRDSLLLRAMGLSHSDVIERATTAQSSTLAREVATYRERSGRTPQELQVARVPITGGPEVDLAFDSTNVQSPDWLFNAAPTMLEVEMLEVGDERLERRWRVFSGRDEADRAASVLASAHRLREVMAGVEPPTWWRQNDRAGDWRIPLPEGLRARTVAHLAVQVGPSDVTVIASGRNPDRRDGVIQLADNIARALPEPG